MEEILVTEPNSNVLEYLKNEFDKNSINYQISFKEEWEDSIRIAKYTEKIVVFVDYDDVESLRLEARQKLKALKPVSVGQASRISGVSPADISVLLVYLSSKNKKENG